MKDLNQRFWNKVKKTKTCWVWIGCKNSRGYGAIGINGKWANTHRFSYEIHYGKINNKKWVLHKCDNPSCVKPSHLFLGTAKDNMQDKIKKGRHSPGKIKGEKNPKAVLREIDVLNIRHIFNSNKFSRKEIAKMFKVHQCTIRDITYNRTWKHLTPLKN